VRHRARRAGVQRRASSPRTSSVPGSRPIAALSLQQQRYLDPGCYAADSKLTTARTFSATLIKAGARRFTVSDADTLQQPAHRPDHAAGTLPACPRHTATAVTNTPSTSPSPSRTRLECRHRLHRPRFTSPPATCWRCPAREDAAEYAFTAADAGNPIPFSPALMTPRQPRRITAAAGRIRACRSARRSAVGVV